VTDLEQTTPVLAASSWPTNADLIADVARLGYLTADRLTLDPTYGRGLWWKKWKPDELVAHDLRVDGTDFRALPYPDDTFEAIAFDPPYVSVGGRKTTGIGDLHDRFGLTDAPTSPAGVQELIDDGLVEMHRVAIPGAFVLVKCQDYVSSGRLWPGTHLTLSKALELGFELVDRFEHVAGVRPQPTGRSRACTTCRDGRPCELEECSDGRIPTRQQHARRNVSTLFVLRSRKALR